MAKLKREQIVFFASWDAETWEPLGRDNDDLSLELNPDVENGKNVLGETYVTHSGYEPELDMETYYADPERALYEKMLDNAISRNYDDDAMSGYFGVAYFRDVDTKTGALSGDFHMQPAKLIPQSLGGDTSGLGAPFNVYPEGTPSTKTITYSRTSHTATVSDYLPAAESAATVAAQGQTLAEAGNKPVSDLMSADTAIKWNGLTGTVYGTLYDVTGWDDLPRGPHDGHFFVTNIDPAYTGKSITYIKGDGPGSTCEKAGANDLVWIMRKEEGPTFTLKSDGVTVFTVDLSQTAEGPKEE